jgi:uncharacterized membrane protein
MLIVAAATILGNYVMLAQNWIVKAVGSMTPIAGGLLGALGLAISSDANYRSWWWLPLVVDPGTSYVLVRFLWRKSFGGSTAG